MRPAPSHRKNYLLKKLNEEMLDICVFRSFRSCSLNTKTAQLDSRRLVQRAPSRLYRAAADSPGEIDPCAKYYCPNTCIGPEFIVRATKPSKEIHIKGAKVSSSSSSSCSGRIRFDSCSLYPQNETGPSISSSVILCVFVRLVYIVVLV
jgi:hypothetical protein